MSEVMRPVVEVHSEECWSENRRGLQTSTPDIHQTCRDGAPANPHGLRQTGKRCHRISGILRTSSKPDNSQGRTARDWLTVESDSTGLNGVGGAGKGSLT